MAIVVNKPLPEFEANATGGVKVTLSVLDAVLVLPAASATVPAGS